MYLYKTTIFRDTTDVIGIDVAQNDADKSDFETNYKASTVLVDEVIIAETTFLTELTYAAFKSKVALWSDVKRIENAKKYILHILSSTSL